MSKRGSKGMLATGLAAALLCATADDASAAELFVTSALDDNSDGTLRKEVADAVNGDTVVINPGVNPSLTSGVEIAVDADITIRGQGTAATTVDAVASTFANRAFNVQPGVTATIDRLRITGGQAPDGTNAMTPGTGGFTGDAGGGIRNSGDLTLDSVKIDGCTAGNGGNAASGVTGSTPTNGGTGGSGGVGGGVFSGGVLTVIDSTIQGNDSGNGGNGGAGGSDIDMGGLGANGGNGGSAGGGAGIATNGALTVIGSTIDNNTAGDGGSGGMAGSSPAPPPTGVGTGGSGGTGGTGGGLSLGGAVTSVSNSTLAGNAAGGGGNGGIGPAAQQPGGSGGFGGGISSFGAVTITHATIAGNQAADAGGGAGSFPGRGGGIHVLGGTTTVRNSILRANTAQSGTFANCNNSVVDGGNNLAPANTGCPAGFGTGDPMLSSLADNGGPTETMAISATGDADDEVAATGENCTATDQRDVVRPQGAACDIGAFEITVPALLTVAKAGTGSGTVSATGIDCGADCSEIVPYNSVVVLSAVAAPGSTFAGWSGCDSASGTTCTQTLGSNETVTANFALPPVVTPPTETTPTPTPAPAPKKCKKGQKLKKGKCVKKKRKKKG